MRRFFITSSGTGIGKTLVTTALCWQLRQAGKSVTALKPVISGYDPADSASDSALILRSCGVAPTREAVECISPWRYRAPLAPNMAAALEGNPVEMDELVAFCSGGVGDYALVEGVGGVMAPVTDRHTMLDWMLALGWPVILVGGSYLGAIGHSLSALEVLRARGLTVAALVVSESASRDVSLKDTVATLERFVPDGVDVVELPRLAHRDALWETVPQLSRIVNDGR